MYKGRIYKGFPLYYIIDGPHGMYIIYFLPKKHDGPHGMYFISFPKKCFLGRNGPPAMLVIAMLSVSVFCR